MKKIVMLILAIAVYNVTEAALYEITVTNNDKDPNTVYLEYKFSTKQDRQSIASGDSYTFTSNLLIPDVVGIGPLSKKNVLGSALKFQSSFDLRPKLRGQQQVTFAIKNNKLQLVSGGTADGSVVTF
ncbi:hypothetical protein M1466_03160 [Candidatus Dependentiae bacterium]|nr:hypothetical protein [Candidatus Dependentiae bacterium]